MSASECNHAEVDALTDKIAERKTEQQKHAQCDHVA